MIPHNPMSATEHRKRWSAATARTWDFTDLVGELPPDADRPGIHPEHIFDFHDGLRLIVSIDKHGSREHLHVSASARPDSPVYVKIAKRRLTIDEFCRLVVERIRFLSGRTVILGNVSPGKGIPHFFDPPITEVVT